MTNTPPITRLRQLMQRLRDKEHGCAWDIKQDFASIAPYTLEEAYEVVDVIERGDMEELQGELGDLLLQVVFHSQMAEEAGHFTFDDVANAITDKMIARHPHVFGDAAARDAGTQMEAWEAQKQQERAQAGHHSQLDNIPTALPSLTRAHKLQKRAAQIGFDWPEPQDVLAKIHEELDEVTEAMQENDIAHIEEEIGDLLFVITNLARKHGLRAEDALRKANRKFERRFRHMEQSAIAAGSILADESLDQMETRWLAAKRNTGDQETLV